ncbi:unnamed protein product [Amoebophrya sp. A120]|nr:unnamed protein product [Amoebophrya sp. A120]|eukprot:GSA120T00007260001.1
MPGKNMSRAVRVSSSPSCGPHQDSMIGNGGITNRVVVVSPASAVREQVQQVEPRQVVTTKNKNAARLSPSWSGSRNMKTGLGCSYSALLSPALLLLLSSLLVLVREREVGNFRSLSDVFLGQLLREDHHLQVTRGADGGAGGLGLLLFAQAARPEGQKTGLARGFLLKEPKTASRRASTSTAVTLQPGTGAPGAPPGNIDPAGRSSCAGGSSAASDSRTSLAASEPRGSETDHKDWLKAQVQQQPEGRRSRGEEDWERVLKQFVANPLPPTNTIPEQFHFATGPVPSTPTRSDDDPGTKKHVAPRTGTATSPTARSTSKGSRGRRGSTSSSFPEVPGFARGFLNKPCSHRGTSTAVTAPGAAGAAAPPPGNINPAGSCAGGSSSSTASGSINSSLPAPGQRSSTTDDAAADPSHTRSSWCEIEKPPGLRHEFTSIHEKPGSPLTAAEEEQLRKFLEEAANPNAEYDLEDDNKKVVVPRYHYMEAGNLLTPEGLEAWKVKMRHLLPSSGGPDYDPGTNAASSTENPPRPGTATSSPTARSTSRGSRGGRGSTSSSFPDKPKPSPSARRRTSTAVTAPLAAGAAPPPGNNAAGGSAGGSSTAWSTTKTSLSSKPPSGTTDTAAAGPTKASGPARTSRHEEVAELQLRPGSSFNEHVVAPPGSGTGRSRSFSSSSPEGRMRRGSCRAAAGSRSGHSPRSSNSRSRSKSPSPGRPARAGISQALAAPATHLDTVPPNQGVEPSSELALAVQNIATRSHQTLARSCGSSEGSADDTEDYDNDYPRAPGKSFFPSPRQRLRQEAKTTLNAKKLSDEKEFYKLIGTDTWIRRLYQVSKNFAGFFQNKDQNTYGPAIKSRRNLYNAHDKLPKPEQFVRADENTKTSKQQERKIYELVAIWMKDWVKADKKGGIFTADEEEFVQIVVETLTYWNVTRPATEQQTAEQTNNKPQSERTNPGPAKQTNEQTAKQSERTKRRANEQTQGPQTEKPQSDEDGISDEHKYSVHQEVLLQIAMQATTVFFTWAGKGNPQVDAETRPLLQAVQTLLFLLARPVLRKEVTDLRGNMQIGKRLLWRKPQLFRLDQFQTKTRDTVVDVDANVRIYVVQDRFLEGAAATPCASCDVRRDEGGAAGATVADSATVVFLPVQLMHTRDDEYSRSYSFPFSFFEAPNACLTVSKRTAKQEVHRAGTPAVPQLQVAGTHLQTRGPSKTNDEESSALAAQNHVHRQIYFQNGQTLEQRAVMLHLIHPWEAFAVWERNKKPASLGEEESRSLGAMKVLGQFVLGPAQAENLKNTSSYQAFERKFLDVKDRTRWPPCPGPGSISSYILVVSFTGGLSDSFQIPGELITLSSPEDHSVFQRILDNNKALSDAVAKNQTALTVALPISMPLPEDECEEVIQANLLRAQQEDASYGREEQQASLEYFPFSSEEQARAHVRQELMEAMGIEEAELAAANSALEEEARKSKELLREQELPSGPSSAPAAPASAVAQFREDELGQPAHQMLSRRSEEQIAESSFTLRAKAASAHVEQMIDNFSGETVSPKLKEVFNDERTKLEQKLLEWQQKWNKQANEIRPEASARHPDAPPSDQKKNKFAQKREERRQAAEKKAQADREEQRKRLDTAKQTVVQRIVDRVKKNWKIVKELRKTSRTLSQAAGATTTHGEGPHTAASSATMVREKAPHWTVKGSHFVLHAPGQAAVTVRRRHKGDY